MRPSRRPNYRNALNALSLFGEKGLIRQWNILLLYKLYCHVPRRHREIVPSLPLRSTVDKIQKSLFMASKTSLLNFTDPSVRQPPPGQARPYPLPTSTGEIPFTVPSHIEVQAKTWYAVHGQITANSIPLIVLHGGPGATHNYLKTLSLLSTGPYARPVIIYDQIGCGNSTRFRERRGDDSFWKPQLFIDELNNLVRYFGLERFDLIGQSWGGMLGAQYASTRPAGLRKLVISDSPSDMATWVAVAKELLSLLPADVQETLKRCEEEGKTDSEEYEAGVLEFYKLFGCRVDPMPEELLETLKNLKEDDTVYYTMVSAFDIESLDGKL